MEIFDTVTMTIVFHKEDDLKTPILTIKRSESIVVPEVGNVVIFDGKAYKVVNKIYNYSSYNIGVILSINL